MTKRERAYTKKIQELIDKTGKLGDRELKRVLAMLETARTNVAATVASTEWDIYYIPQAKEAVGNAIVNFKAQYMAGHTDALNNIWNAGIDGIDSPLQFVGIRLSAPEISRTALEIMQGYSADLIEGLAADALKKINGEIAMGIMGQKTPFEVMKGIGRNLTDKSVFKSISARAEAITRTELGNVNSAAREARMQAIVGNTEPDMDWQKKWHSSGKAHPRDTHAALNGVTVDMDKDFPGGLPYPHAPELPASEVVNCG
jgi:hypothetical protein